MHIQALGICCDGLTKIKLFPVLETSFESLVALILRATASQNLGAQFSCVTS